MLLRKFYGALLMSPKFVQGQREHGYVGVGRDRASRRAGGRPTERAYPDDCTPQTSGAKLATRRSLYVLFSETLRFEHDLTPSSVTWEEIFVDFVFVL